MPAGELAKVMDALRVAMDAEDVQAIHAALMRAVEGCHPELRVGVGQSRRTLIGQETGPLDSMPPGADAGGTMQPQSTMGTSEDFMIESPDERGAARPAVLLSPGAPRRTLGAPSPCP